MSTRRKRAVRLEDMDFDGEDIMSSLSGIIDDANQGFQEWDDPTTMIGDIIETVSNLYRYLFGSYLDTANDMWGGEFEFYPDYEQGKDLLRSISDKANYLIEFIDGMATVDIKRSTEVEDRLHELFEIAEEAKYHLIDGR